MIAPTLHSWNTILVAAIIMYIAPCNNSETAGVITILHTPGDISLGRPSCV